MARLRRIEIAMVAFIAAAALLPAGNAAAAPPTWAFRGGLIAILEDNGLEGDPAPILPLPGAALAIPLVWRLDAEPSIDLYSAVYGFSDLLGRPVPYALEYRSTRVVSALVGLPLAITVPLPGGVRWRFLAGPAFDLRLCLVAEGLEGADLEDASAETADTAAYFWGSGRWVSPQIGTGVEIPASDKFWLGIEARAWIPAYRLWTGEELPAAEGWRLALSLRAGQR
ncbi:MAG TPA: hypothetical protein DIC34_11105 [Treponema sp.]|nr:MAG: hypothetical protein A2Y36_00715 [Treponema sp. GWA1_62_8]HCM27075.1 hypothetical protein [Treponema sp.]